MKDLSVEQTTCCRSPGPHGPWQLALHQAYPIQGGEEPVSPPRSGWGYCHCYWCVYGDLCAASPCRVYRCQAEPGCPGQISGWHPLAAAVGSLVYSLASADSLSRVRVFGCTLALNISWLVSHMAQCGRVVQSACGIDCSLGVCWMDAALHHADPLWFLAAQSHQSGGSRQPSGGEPLCVHWPAHLPFVRCGVWVSWCSLPRLLRNLLQSRLQLHLLLLLWFPLPAPLATILPPPPLKAAKPDSTANSLPSTEKNRVYAYLRSWGGIWAIRVLHCRLIWPLV